MDSFVAQSFDYVAITSTILQPQKFQTISRVKLGFYWKRISYKFHYWFILYSRFDFKDCLPEALVWGCSKCLAWSFWQYLQAIEKQISSVMIVAIGIVAIGLTWQKKEISTQSSFIVLTPEYTVESRSEFVCRLLNYETFEQRQTSENDIYVVDTLDFTISNSLSKKSVCQKLIHLTSWDFDS